MRNHYLYLTPKKSESEAPAGAETPLWRQPRLVFGATAVMITAGWLLYENWRTPNALVILADDLSLSGRAYPEVIQSHCRQALKRLKNGDHLIRVGFADRAEILHDSPVDNTVGLLRLCEANPPALGVSSGTSPTAMLESVVLTLESARARGNRNPAIVSVWLNAAEPVNNEPLDWKQLKTQIETITSNNGVVSVFGPTGELQKTLQLHLKDNPRASVSPVSSLESAMNWAYGLAR